MEITQNEIFRIRNKNLIPNSMQKGIISAIYPDSFTVDVCFIRNTQTIVRGIALARSIDITTIKVGDRCKVDIFDETNPKDMAVGYIY